MAKQNIFSGMWQSITALYKGEIETRSDPNRKFTDIGKNHIPTGSTSYFVRDQYNIYVLGFTTKLVNRAMQADITLKKDGKVVKNKFSSQLKRRIARNETIDKFLKELFTHYYLYGNGYAYIVRSEEGYGMDTFKRLSIIHPSRVLAYHDPKSDELVYKIKDETGNFDNSQVIYGHQMIHIKNINTDGLKGIDIASQIENTVRIQHGLDTSLIGRLKKRINSYAVKNKIDTVIDPNDPDKIALEDNYRDMVQQIIDSERDGGSILIYHDDEMELTNIDANPHMFDPTPYTKLIIERLEPLFSMPGGSYNINVGSDSYKTADNAILREAITPLLVALTREFNRKLLTDDEFIEGYELEFTSLNNLTIEDIHTLRRDGILSTREVRARLGLETDDLPENDALFISGDLKPLSLQYTNPNGVKALEQPETG